MLTLALALGGTAALLNLLDAFVLRRLAVAAPERLVGIYPATGDVSIGFTADIFRMLAERQQVFAGLCGATAGVGALNVQLDSGPIRVRPLEAVSGECYELLGVRPFLGRAITREDAPVTGAAARVALVSYRVWRQELGGAADAIGRTLRIEGTPLTIVGVLPESYRGLYADEAPDLALPLTLPWELKLHPARVMYGIGRLRDGTSLDQAAAHLTGVWPSVLERAAGATRRESPGLRVMSAATGFSILRERYRDALYLLATLAACLLLLASVNVGALSLGRLIDLREALAVRLALGAGRGRLARQLLIEALLVGVAAALLAAPLAWRGADLAARTLWTGTRPFTIDATPLGTTFLVVAAIGTLAAIVVAVPGLVTLYVDRWDLPAQSAGHSTRRGRQRGLLAGQMALTFVLAFCAVLFVQNLLALRRLPLGYEPARLLHAQLETTAIRRAVPAAGYVDAMLARIAALPGVEAAAMATTFGRVSAASADRVPVRNVSRRTSADAIVDSVSPGFFRTVSIPLLRGRDFTWADMTAAAPVAIVNRTLEARLFGEDGAVGRSTQLRFGTLDVSVRIVGVVGDASPGDPRVQAEPVYYTPLGATAPPAPALVVRGRGITEASLRAVVEPYGSHQLVRLAAMSDLLDRFLAQERLITSTSLLFALLAAAVSVAGLYAALSHNVARRTREIGIRVAVGATPRRVRELVLGETAAILLAAFALGAPAAVAAREAARPVLSGTVSSMGVLLGVVAAAVAALAIAASAGPARRAARVPVAAALRAQ